MFLVTLSSQATTKEKVHSTHRAEIVLRHEREKDLQNPHASIAEFVEELDVGISLISRQAFERNPFLNQYQSDSTSKAGKSVLFLVTHSSQAITEQEAHSVHRAEIVQHHERKKDLQDLHASIAEFV